MAMTEFTFQVSRSFKYEWLYTVRAESFEEAECQAINHVKHGEIPSGAECIRTTYDLVPVVQLPTSGGD